MNQLETMLRLQLGPIPDILEREDITDIITNPDGYIWLKKWGGQMYRTEVSLPESARNVAIKLVARVAGVTADKEHPIVYGKIPWNGARFSGALPPTVESPCFTIRSHHHQDAASLESYIEDRILTLDQAGALREAVMGEKNILIAGETGAGKTTLAGALLRLMETEPTRILTVEDTAELQCKVVNWTGLYTSRDIRPRDCLHYALRSYPRRIIFGEIRDGEVCYETLQAWISGHKGGMATVHADSVAHTLTRIEELCRSYNGIVPYETIAAAVDVIVHLHAGKGGVKATGLAWVGDWHNGKYAMKYIGNHMCADSIF